MPQFNRMSFKIGLMLIVGFGCVFPAANSQTYNVTGADGYVKPKYLIVSSSGDLLGIGGKLQTEFQRAGFEVVSAGWANGVIQRDQNRTKVAQLMADVGTRLKESDLRSQLQKIQLNWFNSAKPILEELISEGLVVVIEEKEELRFRTVTHKFYEWSEGAEIPIPVLDAADTFHRLSFNYTYRESMMCGKTMSEIHGSLNEVSGGGNAQLVSFQFRQPQLSSRCPNVIVPALVGKITRGAIKADAEIRAVEPTEIDFELVSDSVALSSVRTVMLVPKMGEDCHGIAAENISDQLT